MHGGILQEMRLSEKEGEGVSPGARWINDGGGGIILDRSRKIYPGVFPYRQGGGRGNDYS